MSVVAHLLYEKLSGPYHPQPAIAGLDWKPFKLFFCSNDPIGCPVVTLWSAAPAPNEDMVCANPSGSPVWVQDTCWELSHKPCRALWAVTQCQAQEPLRISLRRTNHQDTEGLNGLNFCSQRPLKNKKFFLKKISFELK